MLDPLTTSELVEEILDLSCAIHDSDIHRQIAPIRTMAELLSRPEGTQNELLAALLKLCSGERIFFLSHAAEGNPKWSCEAARNFEGEEIIHPMDKIIFPLLEPCLENPTGYYTANLEEESCFDQLTRSKQPRCKSLLIMPLHSGDQFVYIDHRFQAIEMDQKNEDKFWWVFSLLQLKQAKEASKLQKQELVLELQKLRKELREDKKINHQRESFTIKSTTTEADSRASGDFSDVVGESKAIIDVLQTISKIGPTNAPVLVNGESGTGKELIAKAIHKNSKRRDKAFISENCGALSENLLESELFGYVKGAFTGANSDRAGLFELADGGTLFLDEVGDTSPGMQTKLLRVLQEGIIRRVGANETIKVDVRIVSATNKDLQAMVHADEFREDLFYRLNVINILIPPLRERRADIPALVKHTLAKLNQSEQQEKSLDPILLADLQNYAWPGNIRELQNEVRRLFALSSEVLSSEFLSSSITAKPGQSGQAHDGPILAAIDESLSLKEAIEQLEKRMINHCLEQSNGNKAKVCASLKIPKTTLYAKLKRYGIA